MTKYIEFYFDFSSPYAYLGFKEIKKYEKKYPFHIINIYTNHIKRNLNTNKDLLNNRLIYLQLLLDVQFYFSLLNSFVRMTYFYFQE